MQKENVSRSYKVGDLVRYTPHYEDDVGPWQMFGDLGVVVGIRETDYKYQAIRVHWLADNSVLDVPPDCLTKVNIFHEKDLTKDI